MSEETLRELLARVHERLRTSGSIDNDARELLLKLMRDIETALGSAPAGGERMSGSRTQAASVSRLEALAVRFEAGHPGIAQLLRQMAEVLGQAGL